ncbi:AMSH-like ubiquitin thioesterase 1 [Primulina huaijiensis]|uniref:AMSH-like ubiquitin thioesterase 1 n=1 Tax=Primulina huaijiensis TaxID=1492673 RepID=UPI003CC71004
MARSSPEGNINISASTKKIAVDNRISIRFYFRIADNILKQADIFREEKNVVDLYVMLLRFSSLVSETIPCHRDYRTSAHGNKLYIKRRLIAALTELEELKPAVQAKIRELHERQISRQNESRYFRQNETWESSVQRPYSKQQNWSSYNNTKKSLAPATVELGYHGSKVHLLAKPVEEHLSKISISIPRPKEETLIRHSILGPNGLRGQWQPPPIHKIQYPRNDDFTPIEVSRDNNTRLSIKDGTMTGNDGGSSEQERIVLESVVQPKNYCQSIKNQEFDSLISFEPIEIVPQTEIIRQPSPPPVLVDVQNLIPTSTPDAETMPECGLENSSNVSFIRSEDPLQLHISTQMMDSFMKLAKSNTDKNLETCGILAGSLRNRKFYITALIIPKQESTSDSCQATNEEEIFEVQDKQCLFPLGWIHTHPTQSCFMSSIDIHTHYSYQIMLPEAIAIVMAPKDCSRNHGIFRLTTGGMTVIRECPRRGFHSHDPPLDGSSIYRHCTDVYMDSNLRFDVMDLR